MKSTTLKYNNTNYFSKTVNDYLSQKDTINSFYDNFPDLAGFKNQIKSKEKSYNKSTRETLVKVLKKQYKSIKTSLNTDNNIISLLEENTFTITTGHQLNLFTGPLYFLYKILSTINLCEQLRIEFPNNNFVPIYWMATEDHDFEEINYFNFKNQKISWKKDSKTAVGKLNTKGLEKVFLEFESLLTNGENGKKLKDLFTKSYVEYNNLTDATRFLTNELFKDYGLVIIDADNKLLKQHFSPFVKRELLEQTAYNQVSKTVLNFKKDYKIQVNPREINLFYLTNTMRERIVFEDDIYKINNTNIKFTEEEIVEELTQNPERFSPNVIMRPLYQEVILPNLCYIGGGGELAYWFELKSYFEELNVVYPILLLRNSALIISKKQEKKREKLKIELVDLFLSQEKLINKKVTELSNLNLDFSEQRKALISQFTDLKKVALKTDKSFIGAVNAQEKKQLNGLDKLEKRLLKAENRKLTDITERISLLQNQLFPNYSLQERFTNFSEMYLEYGDELIPSLKNHLKPLDLEFTILNF